MPLDLTTIGLGVAALVLGITLVLLIRKRKSAEHSARFRSVSKAFLSHFLVPDGEGGEIHIEYAMLCPRGIIIVDVKEITGNIFGSDGMEDWAVITGNNRFTFSNPQPGLFDRTAAVKRMVSEVPVIGYIAFTEQGTFNKGTPTHVIGLEQLIKELKAEHNQKNAAPDAYWPAWEQLRSTAVVTQVGKLVEDQGSQG
jgi:hypothetical protein